MFEQICSALLHIQEKGIIHRDLKPENILFEDLAKTKVKIGDFGCAKQLRGNIRLTSNTFAGSPYYMSPEMRRRTYDSLAEHGFPTDVWAVGVILHELTFNKRPKRAGDGELADSVLESQFDDRIKFSEALNMSRAQSEVHEREETKKLFLESEPDVSRLILHHNNYSNGSMIHSPSSVKSAQEELYEVEEFHDKLIKEVLSKTLETNQAARISFKNLNALLLKARLQGLFDDERLEALFRENLIIH